MQRDRRRKEGRRQRGGGREGVKEWKRGSLEQEKEGLIQVSSYTQANYLKKIIKILQHLFGSPLK